MAPLRLLLARLFLAIALVTGGVGAAQAACQTSVDFTGKVVGDTVTLDVSSCSNDIRSGLYDSASTGASNGTNYPMRAVVSSTWPLGLNPETFTLSNGAQVNVTPVSPGGYYVDSYVFKLVALTSTASTQSLTLYYAPGSDVGPTGTGFGTITTGYTISIVLPASAATVPGAPTIGTAKAGDTTASVAFTAPASDGGATITSYTATSSPGGVIATGTASPLTVTGLTNGTAYTFTVTATNSVGTGPASAASNSVTPKANQTITFANPGAQNFGTSPTLSATASSGLTVSFSSTTSSVCTVTSGGTLSFVATGTCTIDADQAGNSAYNPAPTVSQSFAVNATVPGAPTIGTATAGDTTASVAFTAPASDGGATITSYTATSSPSGFTATGTSSPLTVTGLANGTAYTFTVTATNSVGTGPASAASNSVTPQVPPPVANPVNATVAYDSTANPITLSITGGTPASVAVASAASHGTATASGTSITYTPTTGYYGADSFTYTATNAGGTSAAATVTITVSAPVISVTPTTLPNGVRGRSYTQSLTAKGGASPYSFSAIPATGALPPGISLSSSGQLTGTPSATGTYSFTVTGTDSSTPTPVSFTSATISLSVVAPPTVTGISPSSGTALGGTSVTISGSAFTGVTGVSFGATPATSFTVVSATQITAKAPAGSGTVDVTVTTTAATSATSTADRFQYLSAIATLSNLSVSQGTLSPAFAAGTTSYTENVPYTVSSLTVTPTTTDSTATVTVNGSTVRSGFASGTINLAAGSTTQIKIVVTAQDGKTTQSYTVSVTRAAASTIATLSNLSLSQGSLSPSFASGTTGYSVALPNGTASITVTPTLTDSTATMTVNGTTVNSGAASGAITLSTGANSIKLVVTAQDGTTKQTYTVTANVALPGDTITFGPVPAVILGSAPFDVTATSASGLSVTLTSTTSAVCTVSGKTVTLIAAGTCTIQGTTAGNATYAPGSATLSITVGTRPDPTRDPVVIALIQGQNQMAQGFATAQIGNFAAHLEALHDGGPLSDHFTLPFALPQVTRNAGFDETTIAPALTGGPPLAARPGGGRPGGGRPAVGRAAGGAGATQGNIFGPNVGIWTGGTLSFTKDDAFDIHSNGLSAGVDLQVSPDAVLGLGLGYGFGKTKLDDGSQTKGHATSVVLYGSIRPVGNSFVDFLAGHSALRFTSRRLVSGSTDVATGARDGSELFGQVSAGLEYRTPKWMISPYAKFTAITGHLSAFSETAANPADALHYDRQNFGSTEMSLGLRGSITRKTDYGSVSPFFRAEYHHQFQRTAFAGISYADLTNGPEYVLNLPGSGQDQVTLGLGVTLHFDDGMQVNLDYRNSIGSSSKSQSLAARVSLMF